MAALHRSAIAAPALVRQRSGWVVIALIIAVVVGIAAFQVSQFSSLTNTSYEINELNRVRAEKQARNHELEAQVAQASSLARVDIVARVELGLQPATRVLHIEVNQPVPERQSLPSRFLPGDEPADASASEPWWKRSTDLIPIF
jgi:cell division protein FtsL